MKMRKQLKDHVVGIPVISGSLLPTGSDSAQFSPRNGDDQLHRFRKGSILKRMNKLGKKADAFAHSLREHVRLSSKISETRKGKLSLGARIMQVGGMEKVFRSRFHVSAKERLVKASQCYLSTTSGPIAGVLFISTEKIAFCSERSLKVSCLNGESVRVHYKVLIPLLKIETANQSENVENPSQKYVQIVTVDKFEFWLMGFLNYQKTWKHLQQAVSTQSETRKTVEVCAPGNKSSRHVMY